MVLPFWGITNAVYGQLCGISNLSHNFSRNALHNLCFSHVSENFWYLCLLNFYIFQLSRAIMSVITYNGYFQEYNLSIDAQNELSWSLVREFNLLTATMDKASWVAKSIFRAPSITVKLEELHATLKLSDLPLLPTLKC